MHRVLQDGAVLFADYFGLTRVTPAGKCKTVSTVFGNPFSAFSVGGHPPRVVLHSTYAARSVVLDVATMKAVAKPRWAFTGVDSSGVLVGFCNPVTGDDDGDGRDWVKVPEDDAWDGAPARPRAALGELPPDRRQDNICDHGLYVALHDDVRVAVDGDTKLRPSWRAPYTVPPRSYVFCVPRPAGLWLVAWVPSAAKAHVLRFSRDGTARSPVLELSTLERPAFNGDVILHQTEPGVVTRTSVDGTTLGRVDIAAVTSAARASSTKKSSGPQLDPVGPGRLIAGLGRELLVPWHAESFVDLQTGDELPRKLPRKQEAARRIVTTWMRDHHDARMVGGVLDIDYLVVKPDRYSYAMWWPLLDRDRAPDHAAMFAEFGQRTGLHLGGSGGRG